MNFEIQTPPASSLQFMLHLIIVVLGFYFKCAFNTSTLCLDISSWELKFALNEKYLRMQGMKCVYNWKIVRGNMVVFDTLIFNIYI